MQNAPREHSAILSTFNNPPFVFKIFVLSFFEWPLKTGFTVYLISMFLSLYFYYSGNFVVSAIAWVIKVCTFLSGCVFVHGYQCGAQSLNGRVLDFRLTGSRSRLTLDTVSKTLYQAIVSKTLYPLVFTDPNPGRQENNQT